MSDSLPIIETKKPVRGFASLSPERRREIASQGGKARHASGTGHRFTPEEAAKAGRKGGLRTSEDRSHMSRIGMKGGASVSADRDHMREISQLSVAARSVKQDKA